MSPLKNMASEVTSLRTSVDALKEEHDVLMSLLLTAEPSLAIGIGAALVKGIVLAGASEMEAEVQRILLEFYLEVTGQQLMAVEFVGNKAVKRQFHTLFEWDGNNANSFFGLFGPDFKASMKEKVRTDSELEQCIRDFLSLGGLRNRLVHQNFGAFALEKSADEVYALYLSAARFCQFLPNLLREQELSGE